MQQKIHILLMISRFSTKKTPPQGGGIYMQGQKDSPFLRKSWAGSDSPLGCLHYRPVRILCLKKYLHKAEVFICRGRRIRTLNKGFGDPRVTITPCPYRQRLRLYGKRAALSSGKSCREMIHGRTPEERTIPPVCGTYEAVSCTGLGRHRLCLRKPGGSLNNR